jgi:hypothetical protein
MANPSRSIAVMISPMCPFWMALGLMIASVRSTAMRSPLAYQFDPGETPISSCPAEAFIGI